MKDRIPSTLDILFCGATVDDMRAAIAAGADVNELDDAGHSHLYEYAMWRSPARDFLRVLIEAGADVNMGNPLLWKIAYRDAESARMLIEAGADVNAASEIRSEILPPIVAAVSVLEPEYADYAVKCDVLVRLLLDAGANIHAQSSTGATALLRALENGYEESARLLLDAGGNIHTPNDHGQTPLMMAACVCGVNLVKELLDGGADIHACDQDGNNALLEAAHGSNTDVIKLLLQRGANAYTTNHQGENALMRAAKGILNPIRPTLALFLAHGLDINSRDHKGRTALHHSVAVIMEMGDVEAVHALLDAGADIEALDHEGNTPLLVAVGDHYLGGTKALLERGADVNAKNAEGKTALDIATAAGYEEISALLTKHDK